MNTKNERIKCAHCDSIAVLVRQTKEKLYYVCPRCGNTTIVEVEQYDR